MASYGRHREVSNSVFGSPALPRSGYRGVPYSGRISCQLLNPSEPETLLINTNRFHRANKGLGTPNGWLDIVEKSVEPAMGFR